MSPARLLKRENAALLAVACVALTAVAALVAVIVLRIQDQNRIDALSGSTHDALCAFKLDIERRLDTTTRFRDEIRTGRRHPIPGISTADLQRSIDTQRAALTSLATLDCKEEHQ